MAATVHVMFFFQAEDGIRDLTVTGVQTCALPISEVLASRIGLALDNAGLSQTVSGLERQLEATLANLAAGVIVRDVNGRMVFANADRKSTRLNSSHSQISYAVFCLKKKKIAHTAPDVSDLTASARAVTRRLALSHLATAFHILHVREREQWPYSYGDAMFEWHASDV